MTLKRMFTGILSLLLVVLLGWSIFSGMGDLKTQILLAVGIALGSLYTAFGQLPDWIVDHSGGSITDDDDPSNISPRLYMPVILGVMLLAVIAFLFGLFFM
jgi:hypothetical protein